MRKLFISLFLIAYRNHTFMTLDEFFAKGGTIKTIATKDGKVVDVTYTDKSQLPKNDYGVYWMCNNYTRYEFQGLEAYPEDVPENGFLVHEKKYRPNYHNISIASFILGLLIFIPSMFCLAPVAGLIAIGAILTVFGAVTYFTSMPTVIVKNQC